MNRAHPESVRTTPAMPLAPTNSLCPGEAFVWSSKATDEAFTKSAVKIRCRRRVTHHEDGGGEMSEKSNGGTAWH